MSLFITFEGGEGCGKSIQSKALYRWLTEQCTTAVLIHEPGGTPLGESVRRLLKRSKSAISPLTELLLFNASRSQLVSEVIKPALKRGGVVICDRFTDSTIAYQGYGRGLELNMVAEVNNVAMQGLQPDLTILLDVPAEVGLARKGNNSADRFEREGLAFHRRVHNGFLRLAAQEPGRFMVIDATQSSDKIQKDIRERVGTMF